MDKKSAILPESSWDALILSQFSYEVLSLALNLIWNTIDEQDEMIQKLDEPKIAGNYYVDINPIN